MNIKLHTPQSLKNGSGMNSKKQFFLSLLATTVSIALTFGTAAIVDYCKKQKEKHEIVMMVIYDMLSSLESIDRADSNIRKSMQLQQQIAENPALFDSLRYQISFLMPTVEYTETTERIFSSSIESINTVSNVLFTENVAEFYHVRRLYKTTISDSVYAEALRSHPFSTLEETLNFDYCEYALLSNEFTVILRRLFLQTKRMMDVTDEEIEAYRKERKQMDKVSPAEEAFKDSVRTDVMRLQQKITGANNK
ncbi:MAG: hypothetical protein J6129_06990 [Bacteroidaceae bacterium]|nr:hypothetical protein [Bacteroidaceae bacterium]